MVHTFIFLEDDLFSSRQNLTCTPYSDQMSSSEVVGVMHVAFG